MLKAIPKISSWEIETIDDQVRDSRRLKYLPDVLRGSPHLANTSAEREIYKTQNGIWGKLGWRQIWGNLPPAMPTWGM
jgi:hypothetical protein